MSVIFGETSGWLWLHNTFLGALTLGFGGLGIYYKISVAQKVILDCKEGSNFQKFLINNMGTVSETYFPTFWCFESRMQTVLASVFRSSLPDNNYRREVLPMDDGGEVYLDWLEGESQEKNRPTIVFLPGLTGDSQSDYMKTLVNSARDSLDARCVIFIYRGLGGSTLKTPRAYSASYTDDIAQVLAHVKKLHPESPILGTGVSLGSLILGNYLKKAGEAAREVLVAAFVISCPFDCVGGNLSIEKWGLNLLINRHLAKCLVDTFSKAKELFRPWHDVDNILNSTTVREFDAAFTAEHFGYNDVFEYYRDASVAGHLDKIKVPFFALNAEDDPFQPGSSIPTEEARQCNNSVAILRTKYGGHIGFMEGWIPTGYHFSDRVFIEFIKAVFGTVKNGAFQI